MTHEIIVAGFGGQGVLFTGQLLAYAALAEGREVSFIPSYGPEMRGGTAHCAVVISDEEISSPLVEEPGAALVFNLPSLARFEPRVKPGGLLLLNSSLVHRPVQRNDLLVCRVPASEIAAGLGLDRVANMVMLGAYLALSRAVSPETVRRLLEEKIFARSPQLLEVNRQALEAGERYTGSLALGA